MTTTDTKARKTRAANGQNGNGATLTTPQAMNAKVKTICDILRASGAAGAAACPELSWMLFLRLLDAREEEEELASLLTGGTFAPSLQAPYRWRDWASPDGEKRRELSEAATADIKQWVNAELLPHLRSLKDAPGATPRQRIISQALSGVERTRLDSAYNLARVLDKVDELRPESIDATHIFPLSQTYEGLLLKMGEKGNDGGQFYTPRAVIKAMVKAIAPQPGETVYDPCAGTGGFLAEAFEYMKPLVDADFTPAKYERLTHNTFYGREKEDLAYPITLANLVLHGIEQPNIWHGNTLTGNAAYAGLFEDAPNQFDIVLTNPPFGGKEGQDAQTNFAFKTGATQILFLQHILGAMKNGGRCGMVIDEGALFRTNETAFVQTKRKLLEECDLWCVVSLPGGVFTCAGAGVKTNLLFFTKGPTTERIWYYDLSHLKIGKTTPLTLNHFDAFFALLPTRGDSERSWTVDFAARKRDAAAKALPLKQQAAEANARASEIEEQVKQAKKDEKRRAEVAERTAQASALRAEARAFAAQAQSIEDAIYDLKAVNPHIRDSDAPPTPADLLAEIAAQSERLAAALERLKAL